MLVESSREKILLNHFYVCRLIKKNVYKEHSLCD